MVSLLRVVLAAPTSGLFHCVAVEDISVYIRQGATFGFWRGVRERFVGDAGVTHLVSTIGGYGDDLYPPACSSGSRYDPAEPVVVIRASHLVEANQHSNPALALPPRLSCKFEGWRSCPKGKSPRAALPP